jgi:Leucine-rich repeat (LRR) protein
MKYFFKTICSFAQSRTQTVGASHHTVMARRVAHVASLVLLLFIGLPCLVLAQTDNRNDRLALQSLCIATRCASWTSSDYWYTSVSICSWFGVVCDAASCASNTGCQVAELNLNTNNLVGTLPSAMCSLTSLTQISMHQNSISGQLPNCWTSNASLAYVFLSGNSLTGTLPDSISKLPNLQEFWVDANRIGGTLPSSWGQLTTLKVLSLYTNLLVGTIPPSFGNMSSLISVYMDMNSINGTIPPELSKLSMLVELYASNNQISGTIPPELSQLSQLTAFVFFENRLQGTIPATLGLLSQLSILSVDTNRLVGTIPSSLGDLANLYWLSLYSNGLNGTIPVSFGNLKQLSTLKLRDNKLTGTIPQNFGEMSSLQLCLLGSNQLTGTLPASISGMIKMNTFSFNQNQLTGDLSTLIRLRNMTQLIRLEMQENQFDGNFDLLTDIFSPVFVNASFNRFGPALQYYRTPTAEVGISLFDVSHNKFQCSYPDNYPPSVVLKLSSCIFPANEYLVYVGILVGSAIFLIFLVSLIQRWLGPETTDTIKFFGSWLTNTVALAMDLLNIWQIIQYLLQPDVSCDAFNYQYIFQPVMPFILSNYEQSPKMMTFADWIAKYISMYSVFDPGVPQNRAAFKTLCQSMDACFVPDGRDICITRNDLGNSVTQFIAYFYSLYTILVIRGFIEAIRLIVILYSCWRGGRVFGGRRTINFIIPSPFSVLLVFANKEEFFRSVVHHQPKYTDYLRSSLHIGLLTQAPLLAANLYFLLHVTQVGINFANWLSLINGLLLVPRLMIMSFTSWLQHRSNLRAELENDEESNENNPDAGESSTGVELSDVHLKAKNALRASPYVQELLQGTVPLIFHFERFEMFEF